MKLIYNKNSFLTLIKNLIFVNLAFQFNRKSYIEKPHYFLLTKTLTITKNNTMGWDISYHPISEKQINDWYFDVLDDQSLLEKVISENTFENFYKDHYKEVIENGLNIKEDDIFDKSHGFNIAVTQGFFQKFFYIRGSALSLSENPLLKKYYKKWQEIVPNEKLTKSVNNQIIENYCSGVYIPQNKVTELLNDYESDSEIKKELNYLFSHDRINVFLKALNFSKNNKLGLLEATEVIEPNPMDLNNSSCFSNLFNCDPEGALLYQQAAMEQIAAIKKSDSVNEETSKTKPQEKKSFWKKLFGK